MANLQHKEVNIDHGDAIYRKKVVRQRGAARAEVVNRFIQFVWLIFIVLDGLIGLRVFLKLIAANPENGFAAFVYDISHPFLIPFFGLTSTPSSSEGMVLEIPSLIAMLVYLLVAVVIIKILWLVLSPTEAEVVSYSETIE